MIYTLKFTNEVSKKIFEIFALYIQIIYNITIHSFNRITPIKGKEI